LTYLSHGGWAPEPINFEVSSIALISRRGDKPFEIRHQVPLGLSQAPENTSEYGVLDPLSLLRLGQSFCVKPEWVFEKISPTFRLCLFNCDESWSMDGQLHWNLKSFQKFEALQSRSFDAVIIHGFGSDSLYQIYTRADSVEIFKELEERQLQLSLEVVPPRKRITAQVKLFLKGRKVHGSTCPKSHPRFLEGLVDALDHYEGSVELSILSSSDGGFDGDAPQKQIHLQMQRLSARCRCKLAVNLLVGSYGSPEALYFFTGDPEAFQDRILFSTVGASEGVLSLSSFDPKSLSLSEASEKEQITLQPATPFWSYTQEDELLRIYWPEGVEPPGEFSLHCHRPQPDGRELQLSAQIQVQPEPVRIDGEAQELFALVARCFSDNPYLREGSRASLNEVLAQLEALLGSRQQILAELSASPEELAVLQEIREALDRNLLEMKASQKRGGSLRSLSAQMNLLNNARRFLKAGLREEHVALEQRLLERELAYIEAHPDHWSVWLQPAVDEIRAQLEETQRDVGDAMRHLSTRIRSRKSREDGQDRAVDRHIQRLQERSRARHDQAERAEDPQDHQALEQPALWLEAACPISGQSLMEGIAGLPFVVDRQDISSGNVASGGQNVDRIAVPLEPLLSLDAAQMLMWGPNGQMASPFCSAQGSYNALLPVLLGPASPALLRGLERGIGWFCTGTSAFEAPMAEAIPGALAELLGDLGLGDEPLRSQQALALLRTTALFEHFKSYPYVEGTSVLDESAERLPLPEVWERSLRGSASAACLRSSGCISSLLAKAVGANSCDPKILAQDLFSWGCRNLARSILAAPKDGAGGVEGIKRLAALFRLNIELKGHPPSSTALEAQETGSEQAPFESGEPLSSEALQEVLGPQAWAHWGSTRPPKPAEFLEHLNLWMSRLPREEAAALSRELMEILERFARLYPSQEESSQAKQLSIEHQHFGILALEAVTPIRCESTVPRLADENLELRRLLKAGQTSWIPPRDATLPVKQLNPSALLFLNKHSAMRPLRALLRLHKAQLLGQPQLQALRRSSSQKHIPRVDDIWEALSELLGGREEPMKLLYRAFAFVVANANGYADKQWAESPLRDADSKPLREILELELGSGGERSRRYGPAHLDLSSLGQGIEWPKMDSDGRLPKNRVVDSQGETQSEPFCCNSEEAKLKDSELCQFGFAQLIPLLMERDGERFITGLHRHARGILGSHPQDLSTLTEFERLKILKEKLLPKLTGRVRGVPEQPEFFRDCASLLWEMIQLEGDTRNLRAEESEEFLRVEAERIRNCP